jgi:flagellar protein FlbB
MARFGNARSGTMGRAVVLMLLILALMGGGLLWFDYLGMIDAKGILSPVYRLLGVRVRPIQRSLNESPDLLEDERRKKLEETLLLREQEIEKRNSDADAKDAQVSQKAQDLEDRERALADQEKSFNDRVKEAETREVNVEQNARLLTGMPPENAVKILEAMGDQDVIDILRKVGNIASEAGEDSIVPYWLSKMEPGRAARIQRKMTEKPREGV